MTEIELMDFSERAIIWAYGKYFSYRHSNHRDDLMQEARLNILSEYRKTHYDDESFKKIIPKLAIQGMITYIRRIHHEGAKSGYLEVPATEFDIMSEQDRSIQERILFCDIEKVSNMKGYHNFSYGKPDRIRNIMALLYQGYGFTEIAELFNSDKGNIWRSSRRFGKRLLSAWF